MSYKIGGALNQLDSTISDLFKSQAHIVELNVKLNCKALCSNEQSFDTIWSIFGIKKTIFDPVFKLVLMKGIFTVSREGIGGNF